MPIFGDMTCSAYHSTSMAPTQPALVCLPISYTSHFHFKIATTRHVYAVQVTHSDLLFLLNLLTSTIIRKSKLKKSLAPDTAKKRGKAWSRKKKPLPKCPPNHKGEPSLGESEPSLMTVMHLLGGHEYTIGHQQAVPR